jgi:hypothetical protein
MDSVHDELQPPPYRRRGLEMKHEAMHQVFGQGPHQQARHRE